MKRYFLISGAILGAAVLIAPVVFAQGTVGGSQGSSGGELFNPLGKDCDLLCVAGKIINVLIVVSFPIASIMVLWGGFQMMTAGGDPEKFKSGRMTILYAAIGLVVVLVAQSVPGLIRSIFGA